MIRFLANLVAIVLSLAAPATAAPSARELKELTRLFADEFDSSAQAKAEQGVPMPESERHIAVYAINKPVTLPVFGENVFYIEEYRDGDPTQVIRQRIASFEIDPAENAIRMKLYFIKDDKAVRGAHHDSAKLSGLNKDNTYLLPGCDVFWRRDGSVFKGAMKDKACAFSAKPGEPQRAVRYMITLTALDLLRVDRSLFVDTGLVAGGRSDDSPSVHHRVTPLP